MPVCWDNVCAIPHNSFASKSASRWWVLVGGMPVGRKGKEGSVTSKVTRFEICNKASHCFDGVIMSFTIHECYACNIKQALSSSYSGH